MKISYMKPQKWFIFFGMIGVISFFTHIILGYIFWEGYNPIQQTISELTADGAPNAQLLRVFVGIYEVCFLIFALGMMAEALYKHSGCVKTGYVLLFLTALFSILGFNRFPMTVVLMVSMKNLMHIIITIVLISLVILSTTLISIGYLTKDKLVKLGRVLLFLSILSFLFNLLLWYADLHGYKNIGLLERLTVYPFHAFTFIISWYYTFKKTAA